MFAVATSASIGTAIGLVCGYVGGTLDNLVMRFTDIIMSFPSLLLIMAIVATRGPSLTIIFLAIGLVDWPTTARVVRGEVLSLRQANFVEAASAAGASHWRVARRHLLPNVLGSVIVLATTGIAEAILVEASLSFLGFGVRPPLPTWGGMVSEGFRYIITAPWLSLFPGLAIMVTVVCFNIVGEWLRDRFDPQRKLLAGG
jgi:peptide/nickel transport system permease protein